jgi:tetratricopeptide (TPR) repeat protein
MVGQHTVEVEPSYLIGAFLAGFIGLCVSNFFGFSTVPVNTLLFLYPALAIIYSSKPEEKIKQNPLPSNFTLRPSYFLITALTLTLLSRILLALTADEAYSAGKTAHDSQDYQTAILELQRAVKAIPDEPLYTDELSLTASEIATSLTQTSKVTEASEAAAIAIQLSNRTLALNRVHLNFYKTRAKLFVNLSAMNPHYAVEAATSLDAAIRLAPTDAKLWFNRALLTEQL